MVGGGERSVKEEMRPAKRRVSEKEYVQSTQAGEVKGRRRGCGVTSCYIS